MAEKIEIEDVKDLWGEDPQNIEKLLPPLRNAICEGTEGQTMIKHPLVNDVFFMSWKMANRQYTAKRERYREALAEKDWHQALFWIERPWRLTYLASWWKRRKIAREELADLLEWAWVDAELPSQFGWMPLTLFRATGFISDMDGKDSELDFLLPKQECVIYRGAAAEMRDGLSWTKSAQKAAWFAQRFSVVYGGRVWRATVTPDRILGIFLGRGEEEVVVDPRKLKDIEEIERV